MTLSNTPGAPVWIELFTPDQDAAAQFYGDLFGWTSEKAGEEYGGYLTFLHNGEPIAGCMKNDGTSGAPDAWSVYLESDDVADTAAKVAANGGQVVAEPMQVGEMGHMAVFVDPAGAMVGAWQADTMQGISARAEDGAPAWFETLSNDYAKSVAFYTDVFGWDAHTMSDTPQFRYTTLGEGRDALAGIMDGSNVLAGAPSRWQFYVQVADADATVDQAIAAGATLVQPAEDSPYGRIGVLTDPAGVQFCVMGPNTSES